MSPIHEPIDANVRSSRYLILRTLARCPRCRASTPVIALALPPGHEALVLDDEAEDDASARDRWDVAAHGAVLFHIERLGAAVRARLDCTGFYRLGQPDAPAGCYWANHCECCGSQFDDHLLFCEPEGAFLPIDASSTHPIEWLSVEEPLEAAAAGYSLELDFRDASTLG